MTGSSADALPRLRKAATGIAGLDEITGGGLPCGRTTVVTGPAGCGKTLFGLHFLVHGVRIGEGPGILVTFEETAGKLTENVGSLGIDLARLRAEKSLVIHSFDMSGEPIVQTGAFTLDGLLAVLEVSGARRVVIDTIEVLFMVFRDQSTIRSQLLRLVRWLEDHQVTAVITSERSEESRRRARVEEYVSDCVICLDHRIEGGVSTRRLRVAKYRGSVHGTNEYPFLISGTGLSVVPITSVSLDYEAPTERRSTGNSRLDHMLDGGVYLGSTVLVSGSAGAGKTTLAATLANAACARGERVVMVLYEESAPQLTRDMRSVGLELSGWVDAGLLRFAAARPGSYGLETHLVEVHRLVDEHRPDLVVLDPVTGFLQSAPQADVTATLTRQIDLFRSRAITCVLTALSSPDQSGDTMISSLIDTWISLRNTESNGERNRLLYVIKARGGRHSNQVREFLLTDDGIQLVDAYIGGEGVLTGSARAIQEARAAEAEVRRRADVVDQNRKLEYHISSVRARVQELEEDIRYTRSTLDRLNSEDQRIQAQASANAAVMVRRRWADPVNADVRD